jgi:hypothetical protein
MASDQSGAAIMAAMKMQIAPVRKSATSTMPHVSSPGICASLELSAGYQYEPARHAGDCGNEEDHFGSRQNPIATHLRLNCLNESIPPIE